MPPLDLTKTIKGGLSSVDEGERFSYLITLKNQLPSAGVQGPNGCEYTAWAPSGGSPRSNFPSGAKIFDVTPGNAYDSASGPNRTVASTTVTGGGKDSIYGSGIVLPAKPGNLIKVEGLFYGYFGTKLTDDYLNLWVYDGTNNQSGQLSTAMIETYVGEPDALEPNKAISWNITRLRPGGGSWSWADFATNNSLQLIANPAKTANTDAKTFYLDAIGFRVTVDEDCVASENATLSPVPLRDDYDETRLTFVSADPTPLAVTGGYVYWEDVGPILPGQTKTVTVTVQAKDVSGT